MKDKIVIDGVTYVREDLTESKTITIDDLDNSMWTLTTADGEVNIKYNGHLIFYLNRGGCLVTMQEYDDKDCENRVDFAKIKRIAGDE
jgi:hypothetical protein